ncbi:uncharacterized protein LOC121373444 [Gigantopelta aegis]|uniref:uncharacterized protein LOC121373444 n=1 Tax=Gigantopelta aegis TaxID=1735272 RepID=UPI001B88E545|nr:uncharacterized protein LOC121373444 [Gigantopelta aegis]
MIALFVSCFLLSYCTCVHAHGRLVEPPGRATAWRYGFKTPINYNDNALYCGGFGTHVSERTTVSTSGGKTPRESSLDEYTQGQTITVTVQITANHFGYFEFRLCPVNNVKVQATHACLDQNVLKQPDGSIRKYIGSTRGMIDVTLRLPPHVTCSQCLIQWRYHTEIVGVRMKRPANSVSVVGPVPGRVCTGCADICHRKTSAIKIGNINPDTSTIDEKTKATKAPTTKTPTTKETNHWLCLRPRPTRHDTETCYAETSRNSHRKPVEKNPRSAGICRFNKGHNSSRLLAKIVISPGKKWQITCAFMLRPLWETI